MKLFTRFSKTRVVAEETWRNAINERDLFRDRYYAAQSELHAVQSELSQLKMKHTHGDQSVYEGCNSLGVAVQAFRRAGFSV